MPKSYAEEFRRSIEEPAAFWAEAAAAVQWDKPWDTVLDDSAAPLYRWFVGGRLNTCYNALDYHVESGRGDQKALIYDSPVTNTVRSYTYRELTSEVARFAGALRTLGVVKGDTVVIYMPMVPEAVIAMLACARIGAVHSVVFGGFAPAELAVRIDDAKPKSDRLGLVRHRGGAGDRVQTAARLGHRTGREQTGELRHPAAAYGHGLHDRRT